MDKKNTSIGVVLLLAAFAIIFFGPKSAPPATVPGGPKADPSAPGAPAATPSGLPSAGDPSTPPPPSAVNAAFAAVNVESAEATVTTLSNEFIEARFTDSGGALREVALKKYPATLGSAAPFVFNALRADPILAFIDFPKLDRNTRFERISQTAT
jgi:YidC/Oxa1 family membrane protein insertase